MSRAKPCEICGATTTFEARFAFLRAEDSPVVNPNLNAFIARHVAAGEIDDTPPAFSQLHIPVCRKHSMGEVIERGRARLAEIGKVLP